LSDRIRWGLVVLLGFLLGLAGGIVGERMIEDQGRIDRLEEEIGEMKEIVGDGSKFARAEAVGELEDKLSSYRSRTEEIAAGQDTLAQEVDKSQRLKVGYLNAKKAFDVFSEAVVEEREKVNQLDEKLRQLEEDLTGGELPQEEFNLRYSVARADKLRAQLEIDLAMMEKMKGAKGFTDIEEQLNDLRGEADPLKTNLEGIKKDLEDNVIQPQEATSKISQIYDQFQQLDELLTRVIEGKIIRVASDLAQEKGYDVVLRQENVVIYGKKEPVKDLTEEIKKALEEDLVAKEEGKTESG